MFTASELRGFVRFAAGLRAFLRDPIDTAAARERVRSSIEQREERFLSKARRAVFAYPPSPYRQLLDCAGCEFGDLERMVRGDGLESALEELHRSGVYVTWEEFKGRAPAHRGSRTFHFRESDFDNPLAQTHYRTGSSGSSGRPVRARIDLTDFEDAAPDWAVWFDSRGWMDRPLIFWAPQHTGMANRYLRCAKFGKSYTKWFTSASAGPWPDRLRASAVHGLIRRVGGFPAPEPVGVDEAGRVTDYLLGLLAESRRPLVNTTPSYAARVSQTALERGLRLTGVTFLFGAEPVTAARRRAVESSGAEAAATYGSSECGWIGAQFAGDGTADGVHVFLDAFAVVTRSGAPTPAGVHDALLFTALRPAGPKVLLNAEIGDTAEARVDAHHPVARSLGFRLRLSRIRSFRKITAWGVTLAHSDLYPILEETLPKRFGGGPTDYQLVEEENEAGMATLRLLVSPERGELDERELRRAFLEATAGLRSYYGFMIKILGQADAVQVVRRRPIVSSNGKQNPVVTGCSATEP